MSIAVDRRKKSKPLNRRKPALSAGVVPVKVLGEDWRYLLLRVYGYWDFPKGIVEENEDPLEAALRELQEETGIDEARFSWGRDYRETEPYSYGKVARYYLGEVFSEEVSLLANPAPGRAEHHEFRWVSFDQAKALVGERVGEILAWAERRLRGELLDSASKKSQK